MNDQRVAVLGTGKMGFPLAQRLLAQGYALHCYNRSPEKALPLQALGARIATHPQDAVQASEVVIMMLSDGPAAESILDQSGFLPALNGRALIQMTTVGSQESRRMAERTGQAGGAYVEAPVMGGPKEAESGQMVIMVGAERQVFDRWRPLLDVLGRELVWVGDVGNAALLKVCLNQFMAMLTATLSQAVHMLQGQDIPVEILMGILKQFPYYAPTFDSKLPRMLEHAYADPGFTCQLMMKDVGLAATEARRLGVDARLLEGLQSLYGLAVKSGQSESDYSAIHEALRPLAPG